MAQKDDVKPHPGHRREKMRLQTQNITPSNRESIYKNVANQSPERALQGIQLDVGRRRFNTEYRNSNHNRQDDMKRSHDSPKRSTREPLYDTDIPTPTHAERALTLVSNMDTGTLCTVAREPAGHPYGSFVAHSVESGRPIFLVSHLAEHTRNLLQDPRASLLVSEVGTGDPLARGRVTLVGQCVELAGDDRAKAREAHLKAHPSAAYYADFKDFSFWAMNVESIRYIGGYGRMSWVETNQWFAADPDPIAVAAKGIIQHMNEDHTEAMSLMCQAFTKAQTFESVRMTSIDRYGFEMSVRTHEGPRPIRLAFANSIETPKDARTQLVALTKDARTKMGAAPVGG